MKIAAPIGFGRVVPHAGRRLGRLDVATLPGQRFRARLIAGTTVIPCVIGPGGVTRRKREGDGATPAGAFALGPLLFRPDRGARPLSGLQQKALRRADGWCDDPRDPRYNKPATLPLRAGHERLWRDDGLYDLLVVIDYNLHPVRRQRGSAIFLHVEAPSRTPTAGCVAMDARALRRLLPRVGPRTRLVIH